MNILICDESTSDAEELTDILDYSYDSAVNVKTFCKTSDARSYIRRNKTADICFLELVLREMNDIELARALRALDHLPKPLMPEDVRAVLDKRKAGMK